MTVAVEKLQDQPVILASFSEPVNYDKDFPSMFARILELRDTLQGFAKYYTVIDLTGLKPSFSELVFSLGEARKASKQRRADLPNEIHLVGSGDLFEMASKALSQMQYGGYSAPLHASVEEALKAIRGKPAG